MDELWWYKANWKTPMSAHYRPLGVKARTRRRLLVFKQMTPNTKSPKRRKLTMDEVATSVDAISKILSQYGVVG